jgi:hypothetical protein
MTRRKAMTRNFTARMNSYRREATRYAEERKQEAMKQAVLEDLWDFVKLVARMRMEGERDSNGEEMEWSNDDSWETLQGLISRARGITERKEIEQ